MQDQIDEIMDWFDFEKVHEVMESIGWRWHRGDISVPTIQDLKKEARKLLRMAAEGDGPEWIAATGGFYARKSTYEGKPYLRLSFEVANWEAEE
jgi:hypothetical protein